MLKKKKITELFACHNLRRVARIDVDMCVCLCLFVCGHLGEDTPR